MAIKLGPILGFHGCNKDQWKVNVLVVTDTADGAPALKAPGASNTLPDVLYQNATATVWVTEMVVDRGSQQQQVDYSIGGKAAMFWVPAKGIDPRIAFTSCNGFSSPSAMKKVKDKNERWKHMKVEHAREVFNVLCMGGDQVYADSIWEVIPELKEWTNESWDDRVGAAYSAQLDAKVEAFYFNLYCERWSQTEVADMLANIPTMMMWDDHDIFDGWGSYPEDLQTSEVYRGIFKRAKEFFSIFQQMTKPGAANPRFLPQQDCYTQIHSFEKVSIALLDLRSERTLERVLSAKSWTAFYNWLSSNKSSHLLLVLTIPLVYPDFALLEKVLGFWPGQQELEDDLQDHWSARSHKEERLRLIHRLLNYSGAENCRITILSGDVHVAALGMVNSTRNDDVKPNAKVINQLISSAIVHPPPPATAIFFLKQIADNIHDVDRDITAQMLELPAVGAQFISKRNYLALTLDTQSRIWAHWHVEGEKTPITKVINPC